MTHRQLSVLPSMRCTSPRPPRKLGMFNFGSVDGAPDDAEEEDHDAAGLRCRLVELQRAISDAESLEGELD